MLKIKFSLAKLNRGSEQHRGFAVISSPGKDQLLYTGKVCLVQLVRFLIVKLIYLDLNFKFDMNIVFMVNYFLVGGDVPIDSESLLMTDFVNLR
jgi:hypothetical protein